MSEVYDPVGTPEARKSGGNFWLKFFLFGCLGLLLVVGACTAVSVYYAKKFVDQHFSMDPVKVEAAAAEMLPGAAPPSGYKGFILINMSDLHEDMKDLKMAMFVPSGGEANSDQPGQLTFGILSFVGTAQDEKDFWEDVEEQAASGPAELEPTPSMAPTPAATPTAEVETTRLDRSIVRIHDIPVLRSVLEVQDDSGKTTSKRVNMMFGFKKAEKHYVMVYVDGLEQGFNQAPVEEFIGKLKLDGLTVLEPPKGN